MTPPNPNAAVTSCRQCLNGYPCFCNCSYCTSAKLKTTQNPPSTQPSGTSLPPQMAPIRKVDLVPAESDQKRATGWKGAESYGYDADVD